MGWELLIGGLALSGAASTAALIVLVVHVLSRREQTDLQRIVATPTMKVGAIRAGGQVEVHGVARAGNTVPVSSPVSGREVLAYWIDVGCARRKNNGSIDFPTVKKLRHTHGFWVDDGTGQVWVALSEGEVILPEVRHGGHDRAAIGGAPETRLEITPTRQSWAEAQTGQNGRRHQIVESVIADGDHVYVLGWANERHGQVVIGGHPQAALLVSTFSEAQLNELLRGRAKGRMGCLVVAVLATIVGVVLMALGALQLSQPG